MVRECVCFEVRVCSGVFRCATLTQPGDRGVRVSSFLYCSKVKNCREKSATDIRTCSS